MGALLAAGTLVGPSVEWWALSPLLVLLGGALVLLVGGALLPRWPRSLYAMFTAGVGLAVVAIGFVQWHDITRHGAKKLVGDALSFDIFSVWIAITIGVALLMSALVTDGYLRRERLDGPEIYALYLLAGLGAVVMGAANDLIVLFLGLETLSIALYVMAASNRRRAESQEAGMKYFVLGGFSSAFFLYGIALVYGGSGSTNFTKILASFNGFVPVERHDAMVLAGVAMLVVGLGFKVAAVPFHMWTADVYQGSPTPVTAFMASAGKTAGFAALVRVLVYALPHWRDDYRPVLWALAAITLVVGSVMAVVQTDVKRMLAFSSISHAGFILVGVEAAAHRAGQADFGRGVSAVLLYLLIYSVLVLGTFAVVTVVSRTGDGATDLGAFRGLGRSNPVLALALTVLLLAQAGVPLTSGFIAKFGVIRAAVDEHSYAIAIIAMVSAVIAAYLYLRIMISMWIAEPEAGDDAREQVVVPVLTRAAILLSVAFTLVIGFGPDWLINASDTATKIANR
jgi:NADH-quinone oxidoreductase subunit N